MSLSASTSVPTFDTHAEMSAETSAEPCVRENKMTSKLTSGNCGKWQRDMLVWRDVSRQQRRRAQRLEVELGKEKSRRTELERLVQRERELRIEVQQKIGEERRKRAEVEDALEADVFLHEVAAEEVTEEFRRKQEQEKLALVGVYGMRQALLEGKLADVESHNFHASYLQDVEITLERALRVGRHHTRSL